VKGSGRGVNEREESLGEGLTIGGSFRRQLHVAFQSVLQCVAVCCSVLQCVAACCSVLHYVTVCCSVLQCVAVCCSVLQCAAVSQCFAVPWLVCIW